MPMGTVNAVNIRTAAVEKVKYFQIGTISEIYTVATTTALANGDTLVGPIIPAGSWLLDVVVDTTGLDSGAASTFEVGYTGQLAAFIANGTTTMRGTGGIARANVAGTVGFTATTDTQVLLTVTATAATPVAGTVRIMAQYTGNP